MNPGTHFGILAKFFDIAKDLDKHILGNILGLVIISENVIGDEVDLTLVYDYTEDVVFSLLAAWFIPGEYFPSGMDDVATSVIGSMAVSF